MTSEKTILTLVGIPQAHAQNWFFENQSRLWRNHSSHMPERIVWMLSLGGCKLTVACGVPCAKRMSECCYWEGASLLLLVVSFVQSGCLNVVIGRVQAYCCLWCPLCKEDVWMLSLRGCKLTVACGVPRAKRMSECCHWEGASLLLLVVSLVQRGCLNIVIERVQAYCCLWCPSCEVDVSNILSKSVRMYQEENLSIPTGSAKFFRLYCTV